MTIAEQTAVIEELDRIEVRLTEILIEVRDLSAQIAAGLSLGELRQLDARYEQLLSEYSRIHARVLVLRSRYA